MTITPVELRPDCRHLVDKGYREAKILNAHTRADGSLDTVGLIAAAAAARKRFQDLEAQVNKGGVLIPLRERLVVLQVVDMDHRRILDEHVPGWEAAFARTRAEFPRCGMAKVMVRTARELNLWAPMEKGPR